MNVFNYYLHNFALSLYVCPDNMKIHNRSAILRRHADGE